MFVNYILLLAFYIDNIDISILFYSEIIIIVRVSLVTSTNDDMDK